MRHLSRELPFISAITCTIFYLFLYFAPSKRRWLATLSTPPPPRIRPTFLGNKLRMSWSIDTYANLSLFTLPCVVRKQVTEHVHTSMLFIPFRDNIFLNLLHLIIIYKKKIATISLYNKKYLFFIFPSYLSKSSPLINGEILSLSV